MLQFTESQRVGPDLVTEQQSTRSRGQAVLGTDLGVLLLNAWYSAVQFSERLRWASWRWQQALTFMGHCMPGTWVKRFIWLFALIPPNEVFGWVTWNCHFLFWKENGKFSWHILSAVFEAQSNHLQFSRVRLFATPWTAARQAWYSPNSQIPAVSYVFLSNDLLYLFFKWRSSGTETYSKSVGTGSGIWSR